MLIFIKKSNKTVCILCVCVCVCVYVYIYIYITLLRRNMTWSIFLVEFNRCSEFFFFVRNGHCDPSSHTR